MRCPRCQVDINDDVPKCPECDFHIDDLADVFGDPPERDGAVLDEAGVLSEEGLRRIGQRIELFQRETGCEMVVTTTSKTAPRLPAEYLFYLFNRWEVGGNGHRGIMLLLAMAERRIESEVGFGLEEIVTDDASTLILQRHAVPFFKADKFDEGLYHATELLCQVVENAAR